MLQFQFCYPGNRVFGIFIEFSSCDSRARPIPGLKSLGEKRMLLKLARG